ncbi:MAG: hypothetical protein PUD97_08330 [Paludibacteraceae bacterium]|nr:hypothetical protein [Paludibacteraceae bacterium]
MKKFFTFVAAALFAVSMNAITVAEALQIAGQLEPGATTEAEYEIEGYVTAMQGSEDGGWAQYGNQIFWIADAQGTAASNADGALEIYQGVPTEQVFVTDKVSVKAKLTNYNGLLETAKKGVVTIIEKNGERPEGGETEVADVVITGADFAGQGTAQTGSEVSVTKDGVTFTCDKGYSDDAHATLRCYKGGVITISSETKQIGKLAFQFYSTYTGDLETEVVVNETKWTYTLPVQARIEKVSIFFGEYDPIVPQGPDTITVAQAVAIAEALAEPAENGQSTTDTKEYVVKGFAVQVYPKNDDGTWSFFMADKAGAYGPFSASNTSTDADVVENDFMLVRGKIAKRKTNAGKIQLQIYKGTGVHGQAPQGIENIIMTEKTQKVIVDGVVYIVRDGKLFNLQGVQVR